MRILALLAALLLGCSGFKDARIYPAAEIESRASHHAWAAGGFNVETDRHNFEIRGGRNFGISDHLDDKIQGGAWGGILRWNMKGSRSQEAE